MKLLMVSLVPSLVFLPRETKSSLIEASLSCSSLLAIRKMLRYSLPFKAKFQHHFLVKLSSVSLTKVNVSSLLCVPLAHCCNYLTPAWRVAMSEGILVSQERCFTEGSHCILIPFASCSGCTIMPCICPGNLLTHICSNRPFVI